MNRYNSGDILGRVPEHLLVYQEGLRAMEFVTNFTDYISQWYSTLSFESNIEK
jgi:hypothetical protein